MKNRIEEVVVYCLIKGDICTTIYETYYERGVIKWRSDELHSIPKSVTSFTENAYVLYEYPNKACTTYSRYPKKRFKE